MVKKGAGKFDLSEAKTPLLSTAWRFHFSMAVGKTVATLESDRVISKFLQKNVFPFKAFLGFEWNEIL